MVKITYSGNYHKTIFHQFQITNQHRLICRCLFNFRLSIAHTHTCTCTRLNQIYSQPLKFNDELFFLRYFTPSLSLSCQHGITTSIYSILYIVIQLTVKRFFLVKICGDVIEYVYGVHTINYE